MLIFSPIKCNIRYTFIYHNYRDVLVLHETPFAFFVQVGRYCWISAEVTDSFCELQLHARPAYGY